MSTVSVIEVARAMHVELTPSQAWSIGAEVRRAWEDEMGEPPRKELRQKTNGSGSHCFAVYPPSWAKRIRKIIKRHQVREAAQAALF